MADLENSINPTQSTESEAPILAPESTVEIGTPPIFQENTGNFQENSSMEEWIQQQTPSEINLNDTENFSTTTEENSQVVSIPEIFQETNLTPENIDNNSWINNPIEDTSTHTTTQTYAENPIEISVAENPWNTETSPNTEAIQTMDIMNTNTNLTQDSQSSQKEKLAQLIKLREKKAKNIWFSRWILTWIIATLWLWVISIVFAKDQIINFINNSDNIIEIKSWMTANITDLIEDSNEEFTNKEPTNEEINPLDNEEITDENNEENYYENALIKEEYLRQINHITSIWDNKQAIDELNIMLKEIQWSEHPDEELIMLIYTTIDDIENSIASDETNSDINSEVTKISTDTNDKEKEDTKISTEENNETNPSENDITQKDENTITFTHVDNIEDANWVMSPNCNALNCWDYTQTDPENLILCNDFKLKPDMEDNSHRIWSSWVCRYKDPSELVYLNI